MEGIIMRQGVVASFLVVLSLLPVFGRPADHFLFRSQPSAKGALPYRLFVPKNYSAAQKYPLVITFHGIGECGSDDSVQILNNRIAESWAEDTNQARNPCFVVSPQCPASVSSWAFSGMPMQVSLSILDSLQREFANIDTNRLYVTGLSLGGMGTWDLIENRPTMFAAAVPMSGNGNVSKANLLVHFPIWDFHGAIDPVVNVSGSRNLIDAIVAAGATAIRYTCNYDGSHGNMTRDVLTRSILEGATLLYTEYTDGGHGIWENSYNDPLLSRWLFSKSKNPSFTTASLPTVRAKAATASIVRSEYYSLSGQRLTVRSGKVIAPRGSVVIARSIKADGVVNINKMVSVR